MKNHVILGVMAAQILVGGGMAWAGCTPIQDTDLPLTISDPGSYCLSENLTADDQNTTAIKINANNVTLDLMGFTISGTSHTGTAISTTQESLNNIEIKNGTVTSFSCGIDLWVADAVRAIDLRIFDNTGECSSLGLGRFSMLRDCIIGYNNSGPETGEGSLVTGTISYGQSQGNGFAGVGGGRSFIGNIAFQNYGFGIQGNSGTTIINNTITGNGMAGIQAQDGSTVKNNTVVGNAFEGIQLDGGYMVVDGNTTLANDQASNGYQNITTGCTTCVGENVH